MEKAFRDEWIEEYGDYDSEEAIRRAARRIGVSTTQARRILNARNEFYGALGIQTPGPIKGNPTREDVRRKCDGFIAPENREIDLLVFPELTTYIEHATRLSEARVLRVLIADAEYQFECTEFARLDDFINWADAELTSLSTPQCCTPHLTLVPKADSGETEAVH